MVLKDEYKIGFSLCLSNINLFTIVNNIEIRPYTGSILVRSAGMGCLIVGKKNNILF